MSKPHAILIAGPTASGKSALALAEARAHDGIVINADSMQVYRNLSVLTARPTPADEASVPHALYGYVEGAEAYSVARWLDDVKAVLVSAAQNNQTPVITGGTGLYFKALLEGLSPVPDIADDIRQKWRSAADRGGPALHAELVERDPAMAAQLRPSDRQRIMRALEVIDGTGRSLLDWQQIPGTPVLDPALCQRIVVAPDRELLYERCNMRFESMMDAGAVEEVRALMGCDLGDGQPILGALGVRPIAAMLRGEMSRDEAIEQSRQDTRRYAKRQLTWCRNQMPDWQWRDSPQ